MDEKNIIKKAASVKALDVSPGELTLINQYTLKALTEDEVFAFKLAVCDNIIDRHHEKFSDAALEKMAELFIGRTVIKDHIWKTENQVARIYHTEVITGENDYKQLIAHVYMVKTETNKDLITEIEAGIRKEVSVGFRAGEVICSICKADNRKVYCKHYGGQEYDGEICFFTLENPKDAYEVSFVAVPAQPKAGATKEYGVDETTPDPAADEADETKTNEAELDLIIKANEAFLFIENNHKHNKEEISS